MQQKKDGGGLLSSLWRKRSRTHDNKNLRPLEQPHPAVASTISAQGWMTLRVPPHIPASNGTFYRMASEDSTGGRGGRPQLLPTSRTLGRNYNCGPSNNNSNHIIMPNPDDILPKEAWTDFSGTDDWPRFSGLRRNSASDDEECKENDLEIVEPPPNYVNCQPDHCQKIEDNGNRVCPQPKQEEQPLLNGLQKQPLASTVASESNNNNSRNGSLQQIENNLMEDNLAKNQNDIWRPRHQPQKQPPQPQPKPRLLHNFRSEDQRNATTKPKKQQQNKEVNRGPNRGQNSLHANDTTNGGHEGYQQSEDESDNELLERSPLFKPLEKPQWQDSPLQ